MSTTSGHKKYEVGDLVVDHLTSELGQIIDRALMRNDGTMGYCFQPFSQCSGQRWLAREAIKDLEPDDRVFRVKVEFLINFFPCSQEEWVVVSSTECQAELVVESFLTRALHENDEVQSDDEAYFISASEIPLCLKLADKASDDATMSP